MPAESVLVVDDSPTVLKLVQLVLTEAGYRVHGASDGESGLHAAKDERPDLVLLDHELPDLTGYDVCAAMSADTVLSRIPVVMLVTRADDVRASPEARFGGAPNVVDSITKPFSPDALRAVVEHALAKASQLRDAGRSGRPAQARVFPTPAPDAPAPDAATDAIELRGGVSLVGDLATIPLPDVLAMLADQSQTGALRISRRGDDKARVDVHFRDGRVDLALAVGVDDEFLLGRFLADAGAVTSDVLADAAKGTGLLGAELVARGAIPPEALRAALEQQTAALVYEALRWSGGRFELRRAPAPAAAAEAKLALNVDALLLEGLRRVDEWRIIEREIDDFDEVFVRNDEKLARLGRGKLTRDELYVLELVNGRNSVKDVVYASRMGSFDVTKILYRLRRSKLVRPRVVPVAV